MDFSRRKLEIDGFFSPEVDRFRAMVRSTEPFKPWFDYALDLNRIGMDLLHHATTPLTDGSAGSTHARRVPSGGGKALDQVADPDDLDGFEYECAADAVSSPA
jgi:hypothetical protein